MYGIANDSVRRKHQSKTVMNSICPRWDGDEPFVFPKVCVTVQGVFKLFLIDELQKIAYFLTYNLIAM